MTPLVRSRLVDQPATTAWATVADDHNPLHLDATFAAQTRFEHPIVHGSLLFALVCDALQAAGAETARTLVVRFRAPVPVGSEVTVTVGEDIARMGYTQYAYIRCPDTEPVEVELR
jgi:acyl dehydratase